MSEATILILVNVTATVLLGLLSYTWITSNKRHEKAQESNRKNIEMNKKTIDLEITKIYEKYNAEIQELRGNYTQQFGLVNANISDTKIAIIDRISALELNMVRNFMSKEDCNSIQNKRDRK